MLTMTPMEWVMVLLVTFALVQTALICFSLRASLAKAEQRPAFRGLVGSLSDVRHRSDHKDRTTNG